MKSPLAPFTAALFLLPTLPVSAEWLWIEGETSETTNTRPHPWYGGEIKKNELSGGAFLSHFDASKKGTASYRFQVTAAGTYALWIRANPTKTSLNYSLNGDKPVSVPMGRTSGGVTNLAADSKPDLRFISWIEAGPVQLNVGENRIVFTMDSANSNHGSLDCFVLTNEPFRPSGILKPDEFAEANAELAAANKGWVPWNPPTDAFKDSPIDLRHLNEKFAGENGRIIARGERFLHSGNGRPVRFWAVNGTGTSEESDLPRSARTLAKYGVNLVRSHGAVFDDKTGELNPDAAGKQARQVEALKAEGIYSLLSIYFPLWMTPNPGPGWRAGYDGGQHPFALLYFEPEFQQLYREWWKAILTAKTSDGRSLMDDPALMGVELINEDSFFFWTFNYDKVPDPQMRKLEKRFADWAAAKYGTLDAAVKAWGTVHKRDDTPEGRLGFRGLHEMFTQKTQRDRDTAAFLYEVQSGFYADTVAYLRGLGFKGLITTSNWITADSVTLGPLEKLSYMAGDFIDRHGYFSVNHKGDNAAWSIRNGHTYSNVSALRFDSQEPGKPRSFSNPVTDPMYNSRPSMLSETAWNRPNRHRGEAPIVLSVYGALQDTDAIVHFAFDSFEWGVKPRFFMQPWTLASPTQLGQFPATALIYRQGLVKTGDLMVDYPIRIEDVLALKGSGFSQKSNLDELRKADVQGSGSETDYGVDPLIHFVGRTNIRINEKGGQPEIQDLTPFIDRAGQSVLSSTRELKLDYGKGLLAINAPAAQGVSGDLKASGPIRLQALTIESPLEIGTILAVALDGQPLSESSRILVQAMSEEKPSDFTTALVAKGVFKIVDIGRDPWLIKELAGTLKFSRPDAAQMKVTALDFNGYPVEQIGNASSFQMLPGNAYYLITR